MCNTSTMSMTVPAPGGKVATKPRLLTVKTILLTCMRYIALNPVRAAIVGHPAAYPYSSYAANTRGATDLLVTPHSVYRRLGPTPEAPRAAYRDLFRTKRSADTLSAIRESTNRAWVLGSDQSKARVEKRTARRALPKPRGGDRKSRAYRSRLPTNRV
jgi:putative transposase